MDYLSGIIYGLFPPEDYGNIWRPFDDAMWEYLTRNQRNKQKFDDIKSGISPIATAAFK